MTDLFPWPDRPSLRRNLLGDGPAAWPKFRPSRRTRVASGAVNRLRLALWGLSWQWWG